MISGDPGRMDGANGQDGTSSKPHPVLHKPFRLVELGSAVRDLLSSGTGRAAATPAHGGWGARHGFVPGLLLRRQRQDFLG
jgi:hypothetical protein